MSDALINDGVVEVLQDHLHATEDEELRAALWQTLAGVDAMRNELGFLQAQRDAIRWIVRP